MVNFVHRRERGVALPVMMIILVIMLVSSVYLLKASNSSTLSASNMAYDSALSKAVDLGLHKGFQVLQAKSASNKVLLQDSDDAKGYVASYDPTESVMSDAFWEKAVTVKNLAAQNGTSTDDTIQYVVHRACANAGPSYVSNSCVQTSGNPLAGKVSVGPGSSLNAGGAVYTTAPQIHYIITARIFGPRGGNVINQMVVLIDA